MSSYRNVIGGIRLAVAMLAGALVLGYSTAPIYWLLPNHYHTPWVLVAATFLGATIGGTVAKRYWRNAAAT